MVHVLFMLSIMAKKSSFMCRHSYPSVTKKTLNRSHSFVESYTQTRNTLKFSLYFFISSMKLLIVTWQLERKKYIGNDVVVVVYKEGIQPFDPTVIKSHFNRMFSFFSLYFELFTDDLITTFALQMYSLSFRENLQQILRKNSIGKSILSMDIIIKECHKWPQSGKAEKV
jgi:hypothetical protein